jgi:Sec7-like guanine-nucleotide exchange factor
VWLYDSKYLRKSNSEELICIKVLNKAINIYSSIIDVVSKVRPITGPEGPEGE